MKPTYVIPQGLCQLPPGRGTVKWETVSEVRSMMGLDDAEEDAIVIISVAYVGFRKGVDLFLQCASRVLEQNPGKQCRFVWVGGGYRPGTEGQYGSFLMDQAARGGFIDNIRFAGEINNMKAVYDMADIFLLTSRLDPMPNVTLEALCYGLPVVCFDNTTGTVDFLNGIGLGNECVADYLNVEHMAQKTLAFIKSQRLRKRVGKIGKGAALTRFDPQNYNREVERLALEAVDMRTRS